MVGPLRAVSGFHGAVWSDGDIALLEKGARACGAYVIGEYRFEVLKGVSRWILDEQPDKMTELLLDWFAAHPADSRSM